MTNVRLLRFLCIISLLALAAMLVSVRGGSAQEKYSNIVIPFSKTVAVSCASDSVTISGEAHWVFGVKWDEAGGLHGRNFHNLVGVSGVSTITGVKYQAMEVRSRISHFVHQSPPYELISVESFRLIGQGPGNNYTVMYTDHTTVNADGTVTADFHIDRVDCK